MQSARPMPSIFKSFPLLAKASPRLSPKFYTCQTHVRLQIRRRALHCIANPTTPSAQSKPFRYQTTRYFTLNSTLRSNNAIYNTRPGLYGVPARNYLLTNGNVDVDTVIKPLYATPKYVGYWLLGSAASVFGIVVFGGLTRLTESGLSITEWRPVTGSLPPTTPEAWESEFAKYRQSPEYIQLNPNMDLEAFKQIYWMEWAHRLWGRVVGLTFVLPALGFILTRRVTKPVAWSLVGISTLIGMQGYIGWWMVKSGLKDDLFAEGATPRVSQYRLAAHLGTAFTVYVSMLYTGLAILRTHAYTARSADALTGQLREMLHPQFRLFRIALAGFAALAFTTALSGALVAGLDAGLIYNEFPYMGDGLTPPKAELLDPFYSRKEDGSDLLWRNMTANPSLVQLDHRILAVTTFTAAHALYFWTRFSPALARAIRHVPGAHKGVLGLVHLVWMQGSLGVATLIYMVPTPIAALHQAGALLLLTGTVIVGSRVWLPRNAGKMLDFVRRLEQNGGLRNSRRHGHQKPLREDAPPATLLR